MKTVKFSVWTEKPFDSILFKEIKTILMYMFSVVCWVYATYISKSVGLFKYMIVQWIVCKKYPILVGLCPIARQNTVCTHHPWQYCNCSYRYMNFRQNFLMMTLLLQNNQFHKNVRMKDVHIRCTVRFTFSKTAL